MTVTGCALHSRVNDAAATALAFDILMHTAMTFAENRLRNATPYSAKCFSVAVAGFQYVEHSEGDGREMFKAVCKLGLEGNCLKETGCAVSLSPSRTWIKVNDPKAPAANAGTNMTLGARLPYYE
jgi:ATP-dependent DNA ligase